MKETAKQLIKNGLRLGVEMWIASKVKDAIDNTIERLSPCKKRIACQNKND